MNISTKVIVNEIREKLSDRRDFVQKIGMASAGLAAFLSSTESASAQSTITDVDILQFALNLEYLEAEFYTVARLGKTIDQLGSGITGSGTVGATTGGQKVAFIEGSTLAQSADEIGADERNHVALLRGALTAAGASPIAKPAINLAALGSGFESPEAFIALARAFEDVGVSAYGGAAPLLVSKDILGVAARILAAEGVHTGNLRLHAAIYKAATAAVDSQDILPYPTGKRYISVDSTTGLTAVRTPAQVLAVTYAGAGKTGGGFFPAGVNGNIKNS